LADYPAAEIVANYICFNKYFTANEGHSTQPITPCFFLWKQQVLKRRAVAAPAGAQAG